MHPRQTFTRTECPRKSEEKSMPSLEDLLNLKIERIAYGGEGVGRWENIVTFVPFTAPEDELTAKVTEVKKHYIRAEIANITNPSPIRVLPPCPYFTVCGGCCYQHIPYEKQIEIKKEQVVEVFRRIGRFNSPPVEEFLPSPKPFHWRGKMEFFLRSNSKEVHIGLLKPSSHEVVEIESCLIAHETINDTLKRIRKKTDTVKVNRPFQKIAVWSHNDNVDDVITRWVGGKEIVVPHTGFFQANLFLVDKLVTSVIEFCDLKGNELVVDAYGGSGLFALFLAPISGKVYSIEVDEKASNCAGFNFSRSNLNNAFSIKGDVGEILKALFNGTNEVPDVIVLDPPRPGCRKDILQTIVDISPRRIVYVSCNPATQARDCRFLVSHGYTLETIRPLDMFPQTAHIETVALIRRIL
ncbi:MAG: class I SAM-dependent RNA methyltransferase [Syntrophales bacterium]|nr:class I SAM-dependent RNA methyltransferase [Syntrophales bacterium]